MAAKLANFFKSADIASHFTVLDEDVDEMPTDVAEDIRLPPHKKSRKLRKLSDQLVSRTPVSLLLVF
jgi:hypothetical protein